ncbi:uncharacterized protein LOC141910564 [Tubulanus polymorphus]|uniref:uncharacterized protein LOC141910564 n=1 Tax=Tubulanus polymorphus TaxID=672921 RepID=UPI003DA2F6B1
MSSGIIRRHTGDIVKYTPCSTGKGDQTSEDELDEIHVVSSEDLASAEPRNDNNGIEAGEADLDQDPDADENLVNGPRTLPGAQPYAAADSDRQKLIGRERAESSGTLNSTTASPSPTSRQNVRHNKTQSRSSLIEIVSHKIDKMQMHRKSIYSKEDVAFLNKARFNENYQITHLTNREKRQRRREIDEKFGKKAAKREKIEKMENIAFVKQTNTVDSERGCKWTFVFDPSGRLAYWWSMVVSVAFLYNFWVMIYRFAFDEITSDNIVIWFTLDYTADLLYILDIAFHFRTGFMEDGVLQTDATKLRIHYMNTTMFYIDCLCLLPLDFLYLSIGFKSLVRCFRLVKIYRFWAFLDRTERHTNYPNVVRTITLLHYLFAIFHWNACCHYILNTKVLNSGMWTYPVNDKSVANNYLNGLYWSTIILTTIGDLPRPKSTGDFVFVITQVVFGLLLFATVLGHIANIVASISAARKDFQAKLDGVKTYMSLRRVPLKLQDRVIKWFDYLWTSHKSTDEEKTLSLLPDKLKAEIAIHVHLDTLKRVEIFQNTDPGFLCELVLRLRPVLFSPGDFICRKGEVGKEMYIVNRGRLQVVAENGRTILATLKPGSYFGEISILNMGTAGNRRTASVRSVGYSDLFCLSKKDMWDVLKEYPAARVKLESIAVKRLEKYKKAPLEKAALSRSKSTPGLVESAGKIPIENMALAYARGLTASTGGLAVHSHSASAGNLSGSHPSTTSDNNEIHHHVAEDSELPPKSGQHDHITQSVTTSSVTSNGTETSFPKSPHVTLTPPASPMQLTTFQRPLASHQVPNIGIQGPSGSIVAPPNILTDNIPLQTFGAGLISPKLSPAASHHSQHTLPIRNLSPSYSPLSVSNLYSPGHAHVSLSPNQPLNTLSIPYSSHLTSSSQSLSRDPSSEILLQEIQRLRERLVHLETENATMSIKLNQQQWEVEQRLSEIEMHICGSDSIGSVGSNGDNKESVI